MSLPAVLNEVISVTGVISFPYDQNATSTPVDQVNGVIPNPLGPILLFGNSLTIGGTATATRWRRRWRRWRWRAGGGGAAEAEEAAATRLQCQCPAPGGGRLHALRKPDFRGCQPEQHDGLRGTGVQRADFPAHVLASDRNNEHDGRQPDGSPDVHPGRHVDVGGDRDRCLRPGFLGLELLGHAGHVQRLHR